MSCDCPLHRPRVRRTMKQRWGAFRRALHRRGLEPFWWALGIGIAMLWLGWGRGWSL